MTVFNVSKQQKLSAVVLIITRLPSKTLLEAPRGLPNLVLLHQSAQYRKLKADSCINVNFLALDLLFMIH